ncbi:MAG TPA: KH domain-containing protein [Candidatus Micrarchaeia archaeon]|nr:KH domain-containing protein [Candidatus Micrarchaeia archaeon]
MPDYAELVRYMVRALVTTPDAVEVTADAGERRVRVEVRVAAADVGLVIGRHGRHIEAIRMVVRSAALRHQQQVQVEVTE